MKNKNLTTKMKERATREKAMETRLCQGKLRTFTDKEAKKRGSSLVRDTIR